MKRILMLLMATITTIPMVGLASEVDTNIYGYINAYWEKADPSPAPFDGVAVTREKNPGEYDVPNINVIVQSTFDTRFKGYLNLTAPGAEALETANAWVEWQLYKNFLSLRWGKLYRPFGLYNEILDAVPTYIGIEPPELFDKDHLLLTRTTNVMLHGSVDVTDTSSIHYSMTTGNDEKRSDQVPMGFDVHYRLGTELKVGTSYYTTNGDAVSTVDYQNGGGHGSPRGGVLPWMEKDDYSVFGLYAEYTDVNWTVQVEYYKAKHDALRDAADVTDLCANATLNASQTARFNCGGVIDTNGDYDVETYYLRLGYNFDLGERGVLTPYLQYDVYENLENIAEKDFGGDNEAGLDDNGQMIKWTFGGVYRPVPSVALKVDWSNHLQDVGGSAENYGEVRTSLSYYWRL